MRKITAILLGKITLYVSRLLGNSGSALPGLVAERIAPRLLVSFGSQFEKGIVLVTGTNGKTTTTKMIVGMLSSLGYAVFTNKTGSNFTRGVLSSLIDNSSIKGEVEYDVAVIEVDEAYSRYLAKDLKPTVVTVTNVMRDQLDRYGEIDGTAELISRSFEYAKGVVLNADDPPVASLASQLSDGISVTFFGAAESIQKLLPSDEELLGFSKDTKKGPAKKVQVLLKRHNGQSIELDIAGSLHKTKLQFEGVHNGVNAAAAVATVQHLLKADFNVTEALDGLSRVTPAFGRGEKIKLQDRMVHIALAKNPGGFNQNIRTLVNDKIRVALVLVNDNYADSRDVSWLWDVDFELLKKYKPTIVIGGTRAYDMALRLQYMGLEVDEVNQDIKTALEHALSDGDTAEDITVFPTYTAMLELRKILKSYTDDVEDIW